MDRHAIIVTDIGYGDAGKGSMVDYLVRQACSAVVIRYNGGGQAAHNVETRKGRHHTFSLFGSGSLVPGTRTHLSRYVLVNPISMEAEAAHLAAIGVPDIWGRTTIAEDALLVLPWHRAANRLRELARGDNRHGSCGLGIGEAQADALKHPTLALRVKDLTYPRRLVHWLEELRDAKYHQLRSELTALDSDMAAREWALFTDPSFIPWLCDQYRFWLQHAQVVDDSHLEYLAAQHELLVFEGAQGVLLDEWFGFHPYTTWSTTTPANALSLLEAFGYEGQVTRLGLLRAYTTRHGAGPFVTEEPALQPLLPERHNGTGNWQGVFRLGHLDLVAHDYAIKVCQGLDELAVTGLDRLAALERWQYCPRYRLHAPAADAVRYFELEPDGTTIRGIKLGVQGDLDYQARLTELLFTCSPLYQTVSALSGQPDMRERELLRVIEDHLGLPVRYTSHGPTAADKHALVAC